jgi:acyl carrier protein
MNNREDEFQKWMLHFIARNHDISSIDESYLLECNLFEEGFIDSMGIMNMVMELEEEFNFSFTADDFQDRRFSSILGLKEIISKK